MIEHVCCGTWDEIEEEIRQHIIKRRYRPEDLIPALMAVLANENPAEARRIRRLYPLTFSRLEEGCALIVSDRDIRSVPELIADLFYALDEIAPDGR